MDNFENQLNSPSKRRKLHHTGSTSVKLDDILINSNEVKTENLNNVPPLTLNDGLYNATQTNETSVNVGQNVGCSTPENASGNLSPDSSSAASESDWQPSTNGVMQWIYSQMLENKDPRDIIHKLIPNAGCIPRHINNWDVWKVVIRMLAEPPRRTKLQHVNTFNDVIELIHSCQKIIVLTGAGVSVSCGIPDFRSRDGIYARLSVDFPDLPNPEAMFNILYFQQDPRPFFKFAKEIYPGQFKPSLVHRFIALLEKNGKLLRNYTQNIDTLEQVAGISRVVQCHGSFATATCQACKNQVDGEAIKEDVFKQIVPHCTKCPSGKGPGILKPDIVFFGENLPDHFHRQMTMDKNEVDLLIVIGSALKVRPVALIPNSLPEEVPQILINREALPHMKFDVELLGDGDVVVQELCKRLGGQYMDICKDSESLIEITTLPETPISSCEVETQINFSSKLNSCKNLEEANHSFHNQEPDEVEDQPSTSIKDASLHQLNVEGMKGMWKSRWKQSICRSLPAGKYFYDGKHRYVFPGAEIAPEEESDQSSLEDSSDEDCSPHSNESSVLTKPDSFGPDLEDIKDGAEGK